MPSEHFIEITLNDWKDIHKLTPAIAEQFVFRGQSFETWDLKTKQRGYFDLNDAIEKEAGLIVNADNSFYKPYEILFTNIYEIWEFACAINTEEFNLNNLDSTNLADVLENLQRDIEILRKQLG